MILSCPVSLRRLCVALLFGLALVALPFGHRVTAGPADPALAAFLATGGAVSDICGAHEHEAQGCEACRLIAAFHLPPLSGPVSPLEQKRLALSWQSGSEVAARKRSVPAHPARAPPAA